VVSEFLFINDGLSAGKVIYEYVESNRRIPLNVDECESSRGLKKQRKTTQDSLDSLSSDRESKPK
jgi:hypothetical protein